MPENVNNDTYSNNEIAQIIVREIMCSGPHKYKGTPDYLDWRNKTVEEIKEILNYCEDENERKRDE